MASIRSDHVSALYLEEFSYQPNWERNKKVFESIPNDYYPLTFCEVVLYTFFVVGIIATMLGVMIGFLFWVLDTGL